MGAIAALVVAVLAVVTNLATGLVPESWELLRNPVFLWSSVGVLILGSAALAWWSVSLSRSEPAAAPSEAPITASGDGAAAAGSRGSAAAGGGVATGSITVASGAHVSITTTAAVPLPAALPDRIVVGDIPGTPVAFQDRDSTAALSEEAGQAPTVTNLLAGYT